MDDLVSASNEMRKDIIRMIGAAGSLAVLIKKHKQFDMTLSKTERTSKE